MVCSTEYAVEVNNSKDIFVRQIDVFQTYEQAEEFANNYDGVLNDGEYLNIIYIDYDENENEIGMGSA